MYGKVYGTAKFLSSICIHISIYLSTLKYIYKISITHFDVCAFIFVNVQIKILFSERKRVSSLITLFYRRSRRDMAKVALLICSDESQKAGIL